MSHSGRFVDADASVCNDFELYSAVHNKEFEEMMAWTDNNKKKDFVLAYPDAVVPDPNLYLGTNRVFGQDRNDRSVELFHQLLGRQNLNWHGRYAAQVCGK